MAFDIASQNASFMAIIKDQATGAVESLANLAMSSAYALYNPEAPNNFRSVVDTDVPTLEKIDVNQLPTIAEIMGNIGNITAGTLPTPPEANDIQKYKNHVWEAKQMDAIQTVLTAYMNDMGVPSLTFQDAIFNADKERKTRILSDKLDMIAAKTSARGFKYANIQTAALTKDALDEYGFDLEDLNRKVTQIVTEWARQNFQFSIQQGIAVEHAHMDFAYKYSSIFRELYLAQIQGVLQIYKSQIEMELAKLDAKVKSVVTRAEVLKINSTLTSKEIELKLEKDKLQVQEANNVFSGAIIDLHNNAKNQLTAAQTRAQAVTELVKSVSNTAIQLT